MLTRATSIAKQDRLLHFLGALPFVLFMLKHYNTVLLSSILYLTQACLALLSIVPSSLFPCLVRALARLIN